jgi:hypothetical protein
MNLSKQIKIKKTIVVQAVIISLLCNNNRFLKMLYFEYPD